MVTCMSWRRSSGLTTRVVAHTPDNYPICDWVRDGVYAIVDSGHGFKTLAIGRIVQEADGTVRARDLSYFSRRAEHTAFRRLALVETWMMATPPDLKQAKAALHASTLLIARAAGPTTLHKVFP